MKCSLIIAACFTSAALFMSGLTTPSFAEFNGKPCQCRSKEGKVDEGTVMCMQTNSGEKLMRCEMVLNNSAWVPLANGCAVGSMSPKLIAPAS